MLTVDATTEGTDGGRVRGEGQVVVRPLTEDCNQVSVERVTVHISVRCCQDTVGYFSHLRAGRRQRVTWMSFLSTTGEKKIKVYPKAHTSGRTRRLISSPEDQPLGRVSPSSYSAGSQRRKGMLADPQRVFWLWREIKHTFQCHVFFFCLFYFISFLRSATCNRRSEPNTKSACSLCVSFWWNLKWE